MEMKDGYDWMKEMEDQAREAFRDHQMKVIGPGHWRISRPNSCQHWCDIVAMGNVGLAVWGDIEGCFFAYHKVAPDNPERLVSWIAGADVRSYGREKAAIGMADDRSITVEYAPEVALYDLHQYMHEFKTEDEDWSDKEEEVFLDAISSLECGEEDIRAIQNEMVECLPGYDAWEWAGSIGRVTSSRVIYAIKAVERLRELLTGPIATEAHERRKKKVKK